MSENFDPRKRADSMKKKEERAGGFKCSHCCSWIPINEIMGTSNRNHCPTCLWSKHLDERTPGDRASDCKNGMKPVGLTFKAEGADRYGGEKQGELMMIHQCQGCDKVSINRVAADDSMSAVLKVFEDSFRLSQDTIVRIASQAIRLLTKDDIREINRQIHGEI